MPTGTDAQLRDVSPWVLVLVAWTLLSLGITVQNGAYRPKALAVVVVGLLLVVVAGVLLRRGTRVAPTTAAATAAAAGASLAAALLYDVGLYGSGDALVVTRALSVVGAGFAIGAAVLPLALRAGAAVAAAAAAVAAFVAMIVASPRPAIDVFFILTEGSKRLVEGKNIFTGCWAGNTDRLTDCLYPYGPLTTVVQTPFRLVFGDIRYSYIACLVASAAILWVLAGPRLGPALAALLLVSPKVTFLLEQAWNEPLLLVGLAVMVLAVLSGHPVWAIVGFAFALACKQHVLLLIPLAAWWPAFGWKRTGISVAAAGLFTLPWFLVDPKAFLEDALSYNLDLAPRLDSLSLFTTAMNSGVRPPFALVGALTLVAIVGTLLLLPRTATGFVLGCALVQYVFDVFNKQSFFNHWWFVTGLLLLAVATAEHEQNQRKVSQEDVQQSEPQQVPAAVPSASA